MNDVCIKFASHSIHMCRAPTIISLVGHVLSTDGGILLGRGPLKHILRDCRPDFIGEVYNCELVGMGVVLVVPDLVTGEHVHDAIKEKY